MEGLNVGVIGATSFVGQSLLTTLVAEGHEVIAFTRQQISANPVEHVVWRKISEDVQSHSTSEMISHWICAAPIWVLPQYFSLLKAYGVQRIVMLSSTSRYTKWESVDGEEQSTARRLAEAEDDIAQWAEKTSVQWVILRPTLIYGNGEDKNITEIARFIHRFGFFPLFGKAKGLRQPVHADDVAEACIRALEKVDLTSGAYTISGRDKMTYRTMVEHVFLAIGKPVRIVSMPLWMFKRAIQLLKFIPRYKQWTYAMAQRMNQDMDFDHSAATRDFGFTPRGFELTKKDITLPVK